MPTRTSLIAFQAVNKDPLTMTNYPRATRQGLAAVTTASPRCSSRWARLRPEAQEEGAKFINFFISDAESAKVLGVERGIPCKAATREVIKPTGLDEQSQIALNFVSNLGDLLGKLPPSPPANAGEVGVALKTKSQEVAFGQQSPADAGPAFYAQAVEILSRAKKS
jgi:multiple sugar transport system substrate-binding protein